MSHEDYQLDDSFEVEDADAFFNGKNPDDQDFILRTMIPCKNCGEWRPKDDKSIKETEFCNLCNQSDDHKRLRGTSSSASQNGSFLAELVERLEEAVQERTG